MKILVTGARGFIASNLIVELRNRGYSDILQYDLDTKEELLDKYCAEADFVFNMAGVNRPKETVEFMEGNFGFASKLLDNLKKHQNNCPVMLSSSIQAQLDNPYGQSKKAGEDLFFSYGQETGAQIFVYRFPNVFGKWCKPNYNSAVATFCHNVARELPITVNDENVIMQLVYIDDVVEELINAMVQKANINEDKFCYVPTVYTIKLGEIVALLEAFSASRINLSVPDLDNSFAKKLYSTYLSYLPEDKFSYPLKMNVDNRGSFTEIIRTEDRGQFSVNISKPGITKGNHWHNTKNEKFVVVSGKGVIRFRNINSKEIIEYHVTGEKIEAVDIPPGYTHNITNEGETDMVTFMWCNECFNPEKQDTFFEEV